MAEAYLRQSALAHRALQRAGADPFSVEAGIMLAERPFRALIIVRGDAGDPAFLGAVRAAAGVGLPTTPNTTARGSAVYVSIVDTGAYMDPRSCKEFWFWEVPAGGPCP